MTSVYLGLGSNKNAHFYLGRALTALRESFGDLCISPVYESESVGFKGSNFFNLVVTVETVLSVKDLLMELRSIENANDRDRSAPKFSSRTLDIDILLYGDCVGEVDSVVLPRQEILDNAFVLQPLYDLAPTLIHPVEQQTIAQLWARYDKQKQHLWRTDFVWQGLRISTAD
jgi:2-amino-4-hydroxy-6-hydroxymethyldihydropteridine diphosphokinase